MIDYKTFINLISKYIPTPQGIELNKWIDSLRKENEELREEIKILQDRIKLPTNLHLSVSTCKPARCLPNECGVVVPCLLQLSYINLCSLAA